MYARAGTDPTALTAVLADDVHWSLGHLELPGLADAEGPEGVADFFRTWIGAFEDWGFEASEVLEQGDVVIAHVHQWGRGKGSGALVENDFWQVWHMRDGKASRVTHHPTREDALGAAG